MGSCDADVQLCEIAKGKLFTDPRCADALYLVGVDWPTWLLMYWRASRYISTLSIRITCLMLWLLIINTWYTSACLLCMLTSLNKHSASFVQVILDFDWPLCNIVLLPQDFPNTESGTLNLRTRTYTYVHCTSPCRAVFQIPEFRWHYYKLSFCSSTAYFFRSGSWQTESLTRNLQCTEYQKNFRFRQIYIDEICRVLIRHDFRTCVKELL